MESEARESDAPGKGAAPAPWALGDAVSVRAFRLAGLEGRIAETRDAAREAMALARAAGVTLVIATEGVASLLRETGALAGRTLLPVVVVVPAAVGARVAPSAAERLALRVRQVLGLPSEPAPEPRDAG
jgi:vacuolar-type H+-ATPase subunit F/Vma7